MSQLKYYGEISYKENTFCPLTTAILSKIQTYLETKYLLSLMLMELQQEQFQMDNQKTIGLFQVRNPLRLKLYILVQITKPFTNTPMNKIQEIIGIMTIQLVLHDLMFMQG